MDEVLPDQSCSKHRDQERPRIKHLSSAFDDFLVASYGPEGNNTMALTYYRVMNDELPRRIGDSGDMIMEVGAGGSSVTIKALSDRGKTVGTLTYSSDSQIELDLARCERLINTIMNDSNKGRVLSPEGINPELELRRLQHLHDLLLKLQQMRGDGTLFRAYRIAFQEASNTVSETQTIDPE